MQRDLAAEFVGTFALVSAVCGSALFSAPSVGLVAVAFAVGLSVLAMAFAGGVATWIVDWISGNPYSHFLFSYWNSFVCFLISNDCETVQCPIPRI